MEACVETIVEYCSFGLGVVVESDILDAHFVSIRGSDLEPTTFLAKTFARPDAM